VDQGHFFLQEGNGFLMRPRVIGVAGGTGSGKTTVVETIVERLGNRDVVIIQHDSYYKDRSHLTLSERERINYDHPDALETELLVHHLRELIDRRKIEVPVYDFSTHTRRKVGKSILPASIIIVEGILIFTDEDLREIMDIKVFVDTDDDIRLIRRLQRDIRERQRSMESVIKQYMQSVRPMHKQFVEPSRKYADIIIPEGHNSVAVNLLAAMISSFCGDDAMNLDGITR